MELITAYIGKQHQRFEMNRLLSQEPAIPPYVFRPEWRDFHISDAHKVTVFGGRGTGKTYNLMLRALYSPHDGIMFVKHQFEIRRIGNLIVEREPEAFAIFESTHLLITFNNKTLEIRVSPKTMLESNILKDTRRWIGKEIYVDEFDHDKFEYVIASIDLNQVRSIYCVGDLNLVSLYPTQFDYAKRWARSSDLLLYINTEDEQLLSELYRISESTPSHYRHVIERLAPLDFTI